MAEAAHLSSLASPPATKRKRGHDSSSPDTRRGKRMAPTAPMSSPDAVTAAFIESAVHAAADSHVNVDDFNALQQATVEHSDAADPANASSTAAAALGSMYPTIHVPQSTAETFAGHAGAEADHHDNPYPASTHPDGMPSMVASSNGFQGEPPRYQVAPNPKPAVGSEEWHKLRKDNHKEVERRRRETINEGINELAKIVPGCEKNKGSILQRAVAFITQLKENETQNIEKWTLEKLLTEQAIAELSNSNDKLKQECERLYRELDTWKRVAQNAGLNPVPKEDVGNAS